MKAFRNTVIATAMLGICAGAAMQASASETTEVFGAPMATKVATTVTIADLNLNSAKGQEALHRRLSRAAEQLCGPTDYRRAGGLAQVKRNRECAVRSLSRSLSKINETAVASTH
jgi:UrcA family protein